jgi:YfiR/HmsC-like
MMRKSFLFAILLATATRQLFAAEALLEYQVKAVCVLNAVRFVSWPAGAFESADSPLVIGILGDNPFGSTLEDVVKGETAQQRRIMVRRVRLEEAASVHVLFISHSERDHLGGIFRVLGVSSVLTISEIDRFTESGGMLGLRLSKGKIRFEANAAAASRAQVKINSQLLLLARSK